MQAAGARADPSNQGSAMPVTDDEIREKYLERAIRELNELTRDLQECEHCPRGNLMPVLGSGHPRADVVLLKYLARTAEVEEGVAFYGRSGNAITKSLKRLSIDPLVVYGTLCVKCPLDDPSLAGGECIGRLVEELMIVELQKARLALTGITDGAERVRTTIDAIDESVRAELDGIDALVAASDASG